MNRHNIDPLNPEKQKIAMEMYNARADDGEIAERIDMYMSNVKNWRERNGLKKHNKRRKSGMC